MALEQWCNQITWPNNLRFLPVTCFIIDQKIRVFKFLSSFYFITGAHQWNFNTPKINSRDDSQARGCVNEERGYLFTNLSSENNLACLQQWEAIVESESLGLLYLQIRLSDRLQWEGVREWSTRVGKTGGSCTAAEPSSLHHSYLAMKNVCAFNHCCRPSRKYL